MKDFENKEEMKLLISPKTRTGILCIGSVLGLLLMLIGIICPMCSYNPTVIDEFKRTVSYADLSYIIILSSLCLCGAIVFMALTFFSISKCNWREKTKKTITFAVISAILTFIGFLVVTFACVFYEIPEADFAGLEIDMESGFYLLAIGCALMMIFTLVFALVLNNLANGKMTMENIILFKTSPKEVKQIDTLTDKLNELQKLKESGIISDDEYTVKKEELLKNFK